MSNQTPITLPDFDWSGGAPEVPVTVEVPPLADTSLPLLPVLGHEIPLYRTDGMTRPQWLARRSLVNPLLGGVTIGASAVAAVMQRHPYQTAFGVAAAAKNLADPDFGLDEQLAMEIGIECEPQIRLEAARTIQAQLVNPGNILPRCLSPWPQVLQHPRIPVFTCNLDAVAFIDGEAIPTECKWTNWRNRKHWEALADKASVEAVIGTSVFAYWMQVQAQLSITGLARGFLIGICGDEASSRMLMNRLQSRTEDRAWRIYERDIIMVTIERDEPTIAAIERTIPVFHKRFIAGPEMPEPQPGRVKQELEARREAYRPSPEVGTLHRPDLEGIALEHQEIRRRLSNGSDKLDERKLLLIDEFRKTGAETIQAGSVRLTYKANAAGIRSLRFKED